MSEIILLFITSISVDAFRKIYPKFRPVEIKENKEIA